MMNSAFTLWGFDGELEGNEHRLQARLPLFTRDREPGVVHVARVLDWSPALPSTDVLSVPESRAGEYGQALEPVSSDPDAGSQLMDRSYDRPVIVPGQFVVVTGPELIVKLEESGIHEYNGQVGWYGRVALMTLPELEAYAKSLEAKARVRFDREVGTGDVTPAAKAALAVMRNVGVGDLRNHLLRTLVAHWLEGETDQYRRVMRMAEVRLHDDSERLDKEVRQHFAIASEYRQRTSELRAT
jgi:hypothetical protein